MFTQKVFAEKEGYNFPLLSDFWPHGAVASKYGVFNEDRGLALRGTFIIDKAGIVRWSVINSPAEARKIEDYRSALASL
jgi:alkyl hydroperoxide reductase subunit AhpC